MKVCSLTESVLLIRATAAGRAETCSRRTLAIVVRVVRFRRADSPSQPRLGPAQVGADLLDERLAQLLGLARADAVDGMQIFDARRLDAGQLAQRGVVKDDVGRNAALASDPEADGAETVEQIVIDILPGFGRGARALPAIPRHAALARQRQVGPRRAVLQQRDAPFSQRQDRELVVGLPQQSAGGQLL